MSLVRMPMPLQLGTGGQKNGAKPVTKRRYDRSAAVMYAKTFVKRHCSDGYVAVNKKGTAPYREVQPGRRFEFPLDENGKKTKYEEGTDLLGRPIPYSILNDCTHYTSCCIGRPYDALRLGPMRAQNPNLATANAPRLPGGGLNVPSSEGHGAPWLYGIVGAPTLVSYLSRPFVGVVTAERLLVDDPFLIRAAADLAPGDVIAIAGPDRNGVRRGYGHVVLYDGSGGVYAHTRCHHASSWAIGADGARYTCIHILDEISEGA